MKQFPDESQMPRSKDGSEPVRGGSIALNRILNTLVVSSGTDKRPRFTSVLLNAFTIFDNVYEMETFPKFSDLEEAWVRDLNMFLDYLNTYLSHVLNHQLNQGKYCPVVVYFPDYDQIPKDLKRPRTEKADLKHDMYKIFLNRHRSESGLVKTLEHVRCFFLQAGQATYPHRHVVQSFREITNRKDSLYSTGDPVGIMTHIPLDLYLMYRLRNLHLIERHTGRIRPSSEFHIKIDKEGRVPLQPEIHVILGDDKLFKSIVEPKVKRKILAAAAEERWITRSREDIARRVSLISGIPQAKFRQFDFT